MQRLNYSYASSSSASFCNSDYLIRGSCFALNSEKDGGCTEDGYTYYWQGGGSSWSSILTPGCDSDTSQSTIAYCGCGYASTAMVITALSGKKVTPSDAYNLALKRHSRGFMTSTGTAPEVVRAIIEESGTNLQIEYHGNNREFTAENISNLLRQGKMILLTVGAETGDSTFTGGAHWIAIRGITSTGKWKVFSSSKRPSEKVNDMEFDPQVVINTHIHHRGYWYVISR